MGAKQTSQLIPLCHNIPLDKVSVELTLDSAQQSVRIEAMAKTQAYTGQTLLGLNPIAGMITAVEHPGSAGFRRYGKAIAAMQALKWRLWWRHLWQHSPCMTCAKHLTKASPSNMCNCKPRQVAKVVTTIDNQRRKCNTQVWAGQDRTCQQDLLCIPMYLDQTSQPVCSASAVLKLSPPRTCVLVGRADSG